MAKTAIGFKAPASLVQPIRLRVTAPTRVRSH